MYTLTIIKYAPFRFQKANNRMYQCTAELRSNLEATIQFVIIVILQVHCKPHFPDGWNTIHPWPLPRYFFKISFNLYILFYIHWWMIPWYSWLGSLWLCMYLYRLVVIWYMKYAWSRSLHQDELDRVTADFCWLTYSLTYLFELRCINTASRWFEGGCHPFC